MQISVLGESLGDNKKYFNNCFSALLCFLDYCEFKFMLIFEHCTMKWDENLHLFLPGNQTALVLVCLIQSRSNENDFWIEPIC